VGFSYGGAVAQQFAHDHPDRIRRLVLAATTCGIGALPGKYDAMAVLASTLRFYSPSYFDRTAASLYGGVTGRDAATRRRNMATRHREPPSSYGYAMQLLGAAGWSSWPFLSRIRHETLVISGDDDPLIPIVNAQALAARIPRARLEVVEQGGHLFLWDDAESVSASIGGFLNSPRTH
jgi:pimeloyl-ACP methyl ester carboxylesterase